MDEKLQLDLEELAKVDGGWDINDLTPEERAQYLHLGEERFVNSGSMYFEEADRKFNEYYDYLNKKYRKR